MSLVAKVVLIATLYLGIRDLTSWLILIPTPPTNLTGNLRNDGYAFAFPRHSSRRDPQQDLFCPFYLEEDQRIKNVNLSCLSSNQNLDREFKYGLH